MANLEWLIAGGLVALGLAIGFGIGLFISRKTGKVRDLQDQLESTQSELDEYREQVVTQFSETAQKFKTLNDAYVDLHQQLASSASALCGKATGPLLEAPGSVEKLIAADAAAEPSMESSSESSTESSTGPVPDASAAREEAEPGSGAASEEAPEEGSAEGSEEVAKASTEPYAPADAETSGEALAKADAGNEIVVPEPGPGEASATEAPPPAEPAEPRKYGAGS